MTRRYQVEKGVPMPEIVPLGNRGRPSKYRLHELVEPGDSLFIEEDRDGGTLHRVNMAIHSHRQRWGGRLVAQQHVRDGVDGVRIWRVTKDRRPYFTEFED